jgi:hypothetical protein
VLIWLLVGWEIFVLIEVLIRVSDLPGASLHGSSTNTTRLIVGGLGAAVGAAIAFGAIRAKQRVHAEGAEPARAWGVSWSTRWLFVGVGWMAIGTGLLWSVR